MQSSDVLYSTLDLVTFYSYISVLVSTGVLNKKMRRSSTSCNTTVISSGRVCEFTLSFDFYIQGPEWVLAKKSEKCVIGSAGDSRGLLKELWRVWSLEGGSGGAPPENLWSLGPHVVHSNAFWVILPQYPYPQPHKKFLSRFTLISRMVLGVGKKVWNQTKVWRFCPLIYGM